MTYRPAIAFLLLTAGCNPSPPRRSEPDEGETSVTQVTSGRFGEDKDPDISPDGKTLYFVSTSHGETSELFMKKIGSNTSMRLTTIPGDKRFPKVNPASPRYLAFSTNTRGSWEIAILDISGDPGRLQFVSEQGMQSLHPSWSPDGTKLVYCAADDFGSGQWFLKILDFTTGRTHTFDEVDGLLPVWSPHGNTIVFQRMKHRDGWYGAIWTAEFQSGSLRNLTAIFSSDDWAAINPSWSPDGRRIVFSTVGKSRSHAGVLNEGDDIWVIDADGSHPTRLTTHPAAEWLPVWSSDGLVYFASNRSGTNRIWSLKPKLTGIE
jgi:Tol biopolymer transport system component